MGIGAVGVVKHGILSRGRHQSHEEWKPNAAARFLRLVKMISRRLSFCALDGPRSDGLIEAKS